jgi:outer membrane protein TolC
MVQCSVSLELGLRKGGVGCSQGWGWFPARVGTRAVRIVATLDSNDSARRRFLSRRIFFFWFMTLLLVAESARALTLAEAEAQLVANNRELQSARRATSSAEAQQLIAGERPNATFSVNSTSIGSNPGVGPGALDQKRVDTVFRIDQPFERGDKRELRLDAASGLQRAAHNDSLDVLRQQLAALRGAYYDLKQAQERVTVLGESAQLFSGTLAAAQARLKAGDLAPADVAKVQVDFERRTTRAAPWPISRARALRSPT